MGKRLTYSALGSAVLLAAAAGVLLGESAIDQINPLYFQGAAVHPRDRGAVFESRLPPPAPRFADLYGWDEGRTARSSDCVDCEALTARDAFYESGVRYAVVETDWRTQPVAYALEVGPEPDPAPSREPADAAEPIDVALYAGFQIEEKPAETQPVEVAAAEE
jgi:hypothetical protein